MLKVVISGPESSGKTTLVKQLAQALEIPYVQEMARPFLEVANGRYSESDLLLIAYAQIKEEEKVAAGVESILLCDTDLLTIQIWATEKYGRVDPEIGARLDEASTDLYLLCSPDIPWEPDPLRENPDDRERLFNVYRKALIGKPVHIISGGREQRFEEALRVITSFVRRKNS